MRILDNLIARSRTRSPWLLHFDCGSCNGCDIETLACLTPRYDVERFGVINTGNPRHADLLLVTGAVNTRNARVLRQLHDQMPAPKVVVAVGACGISGGVFREAYNVLGGAQKVIPVDILVPGCPPRPEAIIDGVLAAMQVLAARTGLGPSPAETRMPEDIAPADAPGAPDADRP